MNKEDHFIDTDKLGDVLLEFSKKISRFSQNIPDTLFGSLTEFLKNIPDDVKNTQLFANVQKLSNYDLNYEDVWWLVDSYGLIDKEDAEEELMEYYEQENKLHCYSNFAHVFCLCTLKIQYLAVIQLSKFRCYAA